MSINAMITFIPGRSRRSNSSQYGAACGLAWRLAIFSFSRRKHVHSFSYAAFLTLLSFDSKNSLNTTALLCLVSCEL